MKSLHLSSIEINKVVLAIDEVCSNLIIHSNQLDKDKKINLSLKLIQTPKGIVIEFIESGIPFDYENYQEPDLTQLLENKTSGKMGLMLVRRIMDKIEYLSKDNYNVCRLHKSFIS